MGLIYWTLQRGEKDQYSEPQLEWTVNQDPMTGSDEKTN